MLKKKRRENEGEKKRLKTKENRAEQNDKV